MLQLPADRIGHAALSVTQLKTLQEAITPTVLVPFALLYLKKPPKLDYLRAALRILAAVHFIFRGELAGAV